MAASQPGRGPQPVLAHRLVQARTAPGSPEPDAAVWHQAVAALIAAALPAYPL
jgi:hypothetical protein